MSQGNPTQKNYISCLSKLIFIEDHVVNTIVYMFLDNWFKNINACFSNFAVIIKKINRVCTK